MYAMILDEQLNFKWTEVADPVRECAFEFYFSRDFKKHFGSAPKYKCKKQQ